MDVYLDDVVPSIYKNVINHIQTVPRIVISWKNQENNKTFKFESSIHYHNMYSNYLKKSTRNQQKVTEKQYKKIYNKYVKSTFMSI